jgi:hypothetical protein
VRELLDTTIGFTKNKVRHLDLGSPEEIALLCGVDGVSGQRLRFADPSDAPAR